MKAAVTTVADRIAQPEGGSGFAVLYLYDIAGELAGDWNEIVAEHDQKMDVIAILVSAEDLPGIAPEPRGASLNIANLRLSEVINQKAMKPRSGVRSCLVVTKFDTVLAREPELADRARAGGGRALLAELLGRDATGDPDAATLLRHLEADGLVGEVFFVWPEGGVAKPAPQIRGLQAFVRWCFGG
jgi:hypothetical protein